jgi:drug/metabolite transporter (DMT)-like permease
MCGSSAVSALLLLAWCWLSGARLLPGDGRAWLSLGALALVSHCFGQGLIAWCLGRLPAYVVALVLLWQPVCATLLSVAVLGQGLSEIQLLGTVVVVAGLALVTIAKREPRSQSGQTVPTSTP